MHKKVLLSLFVCLLTLVCIELYLRKVSVPEPSNLKYYSGEPLIKALEHTPISGREMGSQMLIHNVALLAKYPDKQSITRAYIGTSRSKVIRPEWYGITGAVNASGNSYNEISLGLLIQADLLKIQFPKLKTLFVETSFLLRRPNRLIVEDDHVKYLGQLKALMNLKSQLKQSDEFIKSVDSKLVDSPMARSNIYSINHIGDLKLSKLVEKKPDQIYGDQEKYMKTLLSDGERSKISEPLREEKDWLPSIAESHVKVQRLRDIDSNYPWDGLFDLFALWGKKNNVQVVFYQPPVRSDLYTYQQKYGLQRHIDDLKRISEEYGIPFIDLNLPELGFSTDWSLFADEDHLETCYGSTYFISAIEAGFLEFQTQHTLFPLISVSNVKAQVEPQIKKCNQH